MDVDVEIWKIQSDVAILKEGLQASVVEVGRLKVDQGSLRGYALTLGEGMNKLNQHVGAIVEGIKELNIDVEKCADYQLKLTESMVALRGDMSTLRTDMREDRMYLRGEMADLKGEMVALKADVLTMREEARNSQTEMREGFAQLREEARNSQIEMREDMAAMKEMLMRSLER